MRPNIGEEMLKDNDTEVLEEINRIKNRKSFKDIVNGKRFNGQELDDVMVD